MDAITLLSTDHRKLQGHFARFRSILAKGRSEPEPRRDLVRDLARDIAEHTELEATGVYPMLRETTPEAARNVERALEQHERIAVLLLELERLQPTSNDFDAKMVVLFEQIRDHFDEEERVLYPSLRAHLGSEGLRRLGDRLRQRRAVV